MKDSTLNKCISDLQKAANKPNKFSQLEKKTKDRFCLTFAIAIGAIGDMKIGFDGHKNHARPHLHVNIKKYGRMSFAVDTGELLTPPKKGDVDSKTLNGIKDWILPKKDCLKFIYENIQNCSCKEDFEPIINAANKFL